MNRDLFLYQIGQATQDYFIFSETDYSLVMNRGLKTNLSDNVLSSGQSRARGLNANLKQDYVGNLSFSIDTEVERDWIDKIQFGQVVPAFFYKVVNQFNNTQDLIFYWQYIEFIKPDSYSNKSVRETGTQRYRFEVEFRLLNPTFIECDSDLRYIDLTKLAAWKHRYDSAATYDSLARYDDFIVTSYLFVNALLNQDRLSIFKNCTGDQNYPLYLVDKIYQNSPEQWNPNLLQATENLNNATYWNGATLTSITRTTDVYGRVDAWLLNFGAANREFSQKREGILVGDTVSLSLKLKGTLGQTINLGLFEHNYYTSTDLTPHLETITLTGQWQTYQKTYPITNSNCSQVRWVINTSSGATASTVAVHEPMLNFGRQVLPYGSNTNYPLGDLNTSNCLNILLTNNNPLMTTTSPISQNCNNRVEVMVKIDGLVLGEAWELYNADNNSSTRLTWTNPTAAAAIIYNSLTGLVFNDRGERLSEFTDYNLSNQQSGQTVRPFYLDALYTQNLLNYTVSSNHLTIQKFNSPGNRQITIKGVKLSHS